MSARPKILPRHRKDHVKAPGPLVRSISEIAKSLQDLSRQAVKEYAPVVEAILRSQSADIHHIESTLDGLLGFCGDPEALLLYKKLCRHYYSVDPAATASYVHAYRDMWESENEEKP